MRLIKIMNLRFTLSIALSIVYLNVFAQTEEEKIARSNYQKYYKAGFAQSTPEKQQALEDFRTSLSNHAYKKYSGGDWQKSYKDDL